MQHIGVQAPCGAPSVSLWKAEDATEKVPLCAGRTALTLCLRCMIAWQRGSDGELVETRYTNFYDLIL